MGGFVKIDFECKEPTLKSCLLYDIYAGEDPLDATIRLDLNQFLKGRKQNRLQAICANTQREKRFAGACVLKP